ncbi:MAG: hypothetical protein KAJ46_00835 [Sedimentisphaerales bacterium]|nr:hypothetical protein [Sedimentisphaerales bacterium]
MIGINFIYDLRENLLEKKTFFLKSLDAVLPSPDCHSEVFLENSSYFLCSTRHNNYPVSCFSVDEFTIYIEGKIYGQDGAAIRKSLGELGKDLISNKKDVRKVLSEWLLVTEGEFIVVLLHNPSRRIFILNDIFSRLPLYYHISEEKLIISRNYRFISQLVPNKEFSRIAIAEYLLLGYSLGPRTFLEDINRLPAASLVQIDIEKGTVRQEIVYEFNFDSQEHRNRSAQRNAVELAKLFTQSCRERTVGQGTNEDSSYKSQEKNHQEKNATKGLNVLSLSGGMDSRAVSAGFHHEQIPFIAITWRDYRKKRKCEAESAQIVAQVCEAEWQLFQLQPASGKDVHRLLQMKSGQILLAKPHSLQYLDWIKQQYGSNINYFTGNGGDNILPDIGIIRKLRSADDLVEHIIRKNHHIPIEVVADLTQISEQEIRKHLKDYVMRYPEKQWDRKYVHFRIYEESFKRFFEGVDRHKLFFWNTSPFWSVRFFQYAMNCPDSQKSHRLLYTKFLNLLNSSVVRISYARNNTTVPISIVQNQYKIYQIINTIRRWPNPIRFVWKKIRKFRKSANISDKTISPPPDLISCMKEQVCNCDKISQYLSRRELENIIDSPSPLRRPEAVACLFTVISTIEYLTQDKSTIEDYPEANLDPFF